MADYVFYATATERFHENMLAAISATDDIIPVDDVRRIADRTASEFVADLKTKTDALAILTLHPSYLGRRSLDSAHSASLSDQVFDLVEEDLRRSLDVRIEWASQFGEDFFPADAVIFAAARAIRVFGDVSRKMFPTDETGRETLLDPAVEALGQFEKSRSDDVRKVLEKAIAPIIDGLHALGRGETAGRWYAAKEACTRLGRGPDGEWFMAH